MNLKQRYEGKRPALLVVPNGKKKAWIDKLNAKFKHSDAYIFRVFTPSADLPLQFSKASTRFENVFFVNNPLDDYSELLRIAERKSMIVLGLHIFRKRETLALHSFEVKKWADVLNAFLANEDRPA